MILNQESKLKSNEASDQLEVQEDKTEQSKEKLELVTRESNQASDHHQANQTNTQAKIEVHDIESIESPNLQKKPDF